MLLFNNYRLPRLLRFASRCGRTDNHAHLNTSPATLIILLTPLPTLDPRPARASKHRRGGLLPMAYVYPAKMRSTRDLLRRRMYLVHKRAEMLGHIQNTNSQYNLPRFERKVYRKNVAERFTDRSVRKSIVDRGDVIRKVL